MCKQPNSKSCGKKSARIAALVLPYQMISVSPSGLNQGVTFLLELQHGISVIKLDFNTVNWKLH